MGIPSKMTILALLLFVTFKATNSAIPDCTSTYMEWTGATCLGGQNTCVNSQCTFSLAKYTYICCRMSTSVVQPACPVSMTPYPGGGPLLCKLNDVSAGCPYSYSCQASQVAGTYICCSSGTTTGVTTTAPTTSAWATSGLYPSIISTLPSTNLIITFSSTSLIIGQTTAATDVVSSIPMPPTSVTGFTTSTAMRYSLLVVDVDAGSNSLRYMMLNAPGSGTNMQSFNGIPVAPSIAINPATFIGTHRIVALLFQTSSIVTPSIPNISTFTIAGFLAGNVGTFGNPVAATYFTVTGTAGR